MLDERPNEIIKFSKKEKKKERRKDCQIDRPTERKRGGRKREKERKAFLVELVAVDVIHHRVVKVVDGLRRRKKKRFQYFKLITK